MTGTVDESAFVQDDASGLFVPSQSRRNIIPWEDMQAVNPSDRWSQISPDLLSTLAIGVNQGSDRANLNIGNSRGAQYTASALNFTTFTAASSGAGSSTVTVVDGNFAKMAMAIWIFPGPTNPHNTHGPYFVFPSADTHVFTLNNPLVVDVIPGDLVAAIPLTGFVSVGNNFMLNGIHILDAPGTPIPFDQVAMLTSTIYGHMRLAVDPIRSVDWTLRTGDTVPATASITSAAYGVGYRVVLNWLAVSVFNGSAAFTSPVLHVKLGGGGGTDVLEIGMAVPANTGTDKIILNDLNIKSDDNGTITIQLDRGGANIHEWINAGGYVEG